MLKRAADEITYIVLGPNQHADVGDVIKGLRVYVTHVGVHKLKIGDIFHFVECKWFNTPNFAQIHVQFIHILQSTEGIPLNIPDGAFVNLYILYGKQISESTTLDVSDVAIGQLDGGKIGEVTEAVGREITHVQLRHSDTLGVAWEI